MKRAEWVRDAPCADHDDVDAFTRVPYTGTPRHREAVQRALAVCAGCPLRQPCLAWVDPQRSQFDGIAGGMLWMNGKRWQEPRRHRMLERAVPPTPPRLLTERYGHPAADYAAALDTGLAAEQGAPRRPDVPYTPAPRYPRIGAMLRETFPADFKHRTPQPQGGTA